MTSFFGICVPVPFACTISPRPGEILGGCFIQERFGSWNRAVLLARLPVPRGANLMKTFARYREESERQKEIYRRKKAEKKILAQQRIATQGARKQKDDQ